VFAYVDASSPGLNGDWQDVFFSHWEASFVEGVFLGPLNRHKSVPSPFGRSPLRLSRSGSHFFRDS